MRGKLFHNQIMLGKKLNLYASTLTNNNTYLVVITVLEIYFGELFSNITNPKACFQARKIRLPFFFISIPTIKY